MSRQRAWAIPRAQRAAILAVKRPARLSWPRALPATKLRSAALKTRLRRDTGSGGASGARVRPFEFGRQLGGQLPHPHFVLAFDHHPGLELGAAVSDQHPASVTEIRFDLP